MRRREDSVLFFEEIIEDEGPIEKKPSKFFIYLYDWAGAVTAAIITVFILFTFMFRMVDVDGESMRDTLNDGDWLVLSSFVISPEYADIVVISREWTDEKPLIKRVIALENDVVDIDFDAHIVRVNGQVLSEPYILSPTERKFDVEFPVTVPEGYIFVMGDNRNNSLDSRSSVVGCVKIEKIVGKAVFRLAPFGRIYN